MGDDLQSRAFRPVTGRDMACKDGCKRKTTRRKTRSRGKKRRSQRGGALYRRKPTITDKIAEGASMFLSGPAPSFFTFATKGASQILKGFKDNYKPVDDYLGIGKRFKFRR